VCDSLTHPYCSLYQQGGAVDFLLFTGSRLNSLIIKNTKFTGNRQMNLFGGSTGGGGLYIDRETNIDMEGCEFSGNSNKEVRAQLLIEIAGSFHSLMH
jgi:hypothetical protein